MTPDQKAVDAMNDVFSEVSEVLAKRERLEREAREYDVSNKELLRKLLKAGPKSDG